MLNLYHLFYLQKLLIYVSFMSSIEAMQTSLWSLSHFFPAFITLSVFCYQFSWPRGTRYKALVHTVGSFCNELFRGLFFTHCSLSMPCYSSWKYIQVSSPVMSSDMLHLFDNLECFVVVVHLTLFTFSSIVNKWGTHLVQILFNPIFLSQFHKLSPLIYQGKMLYTWKHCT